MANRYEYEELRAIAIAPGAKPEQINALGEWFEQYGSNYWNGEYYDADGIRVYPVYDWDNDNDCGILTGFEIR